MSQIICGLEIHLLARFDPERVMCSPAARSDLEAATPLART